MNHIKPGDTVILKGIQINDKYMGRKAKVLEQCQEETPWPAYIVECDGKKLMVFRNEVCKVAKET